jgi:hypothetical protein
MPLDPGAELGFFGPPAGEEPHDLIGERRRFTCGEQSVDGPGDARGRGKAEDRDMIDLVQLEPERGEVDVTPPEE